MSADACINGRLNHISSHLRIRYSRIPHLRGHPGILLQTRGITAITGEAAMQILDRLDHRPIPATILLSGHSPRYISEIVSISPGLRRRVREEDLASAVRKRDKARKTNGSAKRQV
ncbi:unnamed protein product [Lasius platythorax]|uniref:Uncharacterized protein n=1 Tax=Lasius platythorax TaxID=488582 RepID=A0AAV2NZN9_9HYME